MSKQSNISAVRRHEGPSRWVSTGSLVLSLMVSAALQAEDQGPNPPRQSGFHPAQNARQMPAPPPGPYAVPQQQTGSGYSQGQQPGSGYPPAQYRQQPVPPTGSPEDMNPPGYQQYNYPPPGMVQPDSAPRRGISRDEFMARQAEHRKAMEERMPAAPGSYPEPDERAAMHEQRMQQYQEQMQARQEQMRQQMQDAQQYGSGYREMNQPDWDQRQQMMQQRRDQAQEHHEQMRERMQEMQQRYGQPAPGQGYRRYRPMDGDEQSGEAQSGTEQGQQETGQAQQRMQQQPAPQPQYGQRQWQQPAPVQRGVPYGYGYPPPAYGYGYPPPPPQYQPPQGYYPYGGAGAVNQQPSGAESEQ